MKRYIKIVKDWFSCLIAEKGWKKIIAFVISISLGIALTIAAFVGTDTVPATQADYEQLEKKAYSLQQNPNLLLKTDCTINVNGEIATVKFENNECMITTEYNKNFKILSTYREDKSMFCLYALVLSLFLGIYAFALSVLFLLIVFSVFEYIVKVVLKVIKVHKTKI